MKSKKTLDSFVKYCNKYPDLRFWQALLSWSGFSYIWVRKCNSYRMDVPDYLEDTFYFEGRDK